jgi:CubicO group peptidase (beta-lactamase class C family)
MKKRGYRIIDIEVNNTPKGLLYSSIWYENVDARPWIELRDMTREQYQNNVDLYSERGFRVVDFESYRTDKGQLYAAIWEKKPGYAWQVRSDRREQAYTNLWYQYADEGYRLIDFEHYETDEGPRYAGIWAENAPRYQYSRKNDIDNAILNYSNTNNLPGISVVVIQNSDMLYRRGFGFADVDDNVTANSKTIYGAASVSKVIGGTLAAKLEDESQLNDGTTFFLDLTQPTANYIAGLPACHTHTVDQLLSHLSCVGHYNEIPNQTTHYTNATDAVQSIWNTPLLAGCSIGNAWNYSTPAFTFVGAVLEGATGVTVNDLLNDELFKPFGLTSMRVQFENAALPYNRLRTTPYDTQDAVHTPNTKDFIDPPDPVTNPNVESGYFDNSWKVLGGGIETSTYDLARFGWKVLNADILSANARDNRLWTRVNPAFIHGLGWAITTDNSGRSTAEWNGSWTGSRTFLRAYRNNGLVIAVMSNRTDHRSDLNADVNNLTDTIGNIVLAP